MSERKTTYPHSPQQDKRLVVRTQENFTGGMVSDMEPTDLSPTQVAYLSNARGHTNAIKGRKGTIEAPGGKLPRIIEDLTLTLSILEGVSSITCTTEVFEDWMIGCKIGSETNTDVFIITDVTSTTVVEVVKKDSVTVFSETDGFIRGPINASYSDRDNEVLYFLIGREVYYRDVTGDEWKQYVLLSNTPSNTRSSFYKIDERIVLFNSGGIYVLGKESDGAYAWLANGPIPARKLNISSAERLIDPAIYNYSYTYARIKGSYIVNRNNLGTSIEVETPPFFFLGEDEGSIPVTNQPNYIADGANRDFTAIKTATPIEDSTYVGFPINDSFKNANTWASLSNEELDPFLRVTVDGDTKDLYFDFSLAVTLQDVAEVIDRVLSEEMGFTIWCKLGGGGSTPKLLIYSTDKDIAISLTAVAGSDDYCLLTEGVITNSTVTTACGNMVQYLRYPGDRKDITHYPVYRTGNILPHINRDTEGDEKDKRIFSDSNAFAWVEDVAACKMFYGKIVSGVLSETTSAGESKVGLLKIQDVGNTLVRVGNGTTLTIDDALYTLDGIANEYTVTGEGSTDTAVELFYFGAETYFTATKSALGVVTTAQEFDSDDIGKLIFWYDGSVSTIKSVAGTVATVFDDVEVTIAQPGLMDPTYRTFFDTVNENKRIGYYYNWPLRTRFYKPLPYSDVSAYNKGNIISAVTDKNELYYSDTNENRTMGYYDVNHQSIKTIEDGIRCIYVVNDLFIVCTLEKTYSINQKQGSVEYDDRWGLYYTLLPAPSLVQDGIGVSHQYKVANGPNGEKLVITNEPAVRPFNGITYGPNLAEGSIQQTEIQRLSNNMVVDYDKIAGVHLWGKRG